MMGIINNLLLQFVEESAGAEARAQVLERAGMTGQVFRSEVIYTEEEWQKLIGATLAHLGVDAVAGQKAFAAWCFPVLTRKFRPFFASARSAREFLEKVPTIHRDFPSSSQVGFVDKIMVRSSAPDRLVYAYQSPNNLVVLLVELGQALAAHYHEEVAIEPRQLGPGSWEVEFRFTAGAAQVR